MKKQRDYTIPLIIALFAIALFASSCKKDNKQPSVTQPVTPPITSTSTTINISTNQYCNNTFTILPECYIQFATTKSRLDSNIISFTVNTDVNGKATIIGKEAGVYYYKAMAKLCGSSNFSTLYSDQTVHKGQPTILNIFIN